jgi:hypothetical protein
VTSEASGHGVATRVLLSDHLDAVRTLERQAIAFERSAEQRRAAGGACAAPAPPPDLSPQETCSRGCDTKGDTAGHDAGGGRSTASNWDQAWPLLADLVVMALRCDMARFGALTCTAAGDRYAMPGQDANVHDLAHGWRPGAENGFGKSVTWCMGSLRRLLAALDDPAFRMADGRTLLDHTRPS